MEKPLQPPPSFISDQVTAAQRFYLNLKPNARRDLFVVCGGWEQCSFDYKIDRPTFPYFSIEYVASGSGELVLGGQHHVLTAGVVFTYGPGIAQQISSSPTDCLRKYFVDFSGSRAEKHLTNRGLRLGTALTIGARTEVRHAFDALIKAASAYDRFAEEAARLQLELLMIGIARGACTESGPTQRAAAVFERCRSYIEVNFRTLHSMEQVARACHLDAAHLTRLFRRFHNETPFRYVQRLQVQWAAERLQSSHCLVRQVADDLNVDTFQFSRAFKRIYGIDPSTFADSRPVVPRRGVS